MRKTLTHIRAVVVGAKQSLPARGELSRAGRAAIYLSRLGIRILKQWARDKCPQQAAALAFQTALSLVPVTAIAFSALQMFGLGDQQSELNDFLSTRLLPGMGDVAGYLDEFAKKITVNAFGGAGILFTLVTCYTLFSYVEKIFNDVWRVRERRTLFSKFLTFYALLTLLPALAGFSLYQSGRFLGGGEASSLARFVGPLLIQFVALFLMNKLLPRANVGYWPALVGALVSGVCLEATKYGFVTYAKALILDKYRGVYGSLGLVPLLLIWMYAAWLLVLLGAEIAHALQNLRLLEAEERRKQGDEPINALVAAQLLAAVAADHQRGGKGIGKAELASGFGLTPDVVDRIFERLKRQNLVAEVSGDINGYVPARPAAVITMEDLLQAFRATDLETAEGATSEALKTLVADLAEARRRRIAGVTVADLLPDPEKPRD